MKVSDEKIIAALLSTTTNAEAAQAAGLSTTQLYNRMRHPDFKEKLAEARARLMEGATAALQARMGEAVDAMTAVMRDPEAPAQTRLNAAEAVLRNSLKLSERSDIAARMDEIEVLLKEVENRK